jgi:hypothetical protein
MTHPTSAAGDWALEHVVYDCGIAGVAVALMRHEKRLGLAIRWLPDHSSDNRSIGGWMGGETGWFVLPFDFAVSIGRALIERKVAGLSGFDDVGFKAMIDWLLDQEAISDALCF